MDVKCCRMIQVPVDNKKFITDLTYAINELKKITKQKTATVQTSTSKLAKLMSEYYDIQSEIDNKQKELNALELEIQMLMKDYYCYEDLASNLMCVKTFHKDNHRKLQVVSDD